ncbi:hypothetical protein LguiA_032082 [Lonicera macranthoides]
MRGTTDQKAVVFVRGLPEKRRKDRICRRLADKGLVDCDSDEGFWISNQYQRVCGGRIKGSFLVDIKVPPELASVSE